MTPTTYKHNYSVNVFVKQFVSDLFTSKSSALSTCFKARGLSAAARNQHDTIIFQYKLLDNE